MKRTHNAAGFFSDELNLCELSRAFYGHDPTGKLAHIFRQQISQRESKSVHVLSSMPRRWIPLLLYQSKIQRGDFNLRVESSQKEEKTNKTTSL